ncbi:MAG: hypothetical protein JWO64_1408 [Hyphomicrobiales bacterium]|nr:hypothetical protein [Hyphomicrobiales bacterium]
MSLFYLNQRLGSEFIPDEEGADFGSLEDARCEAIAAARESMARMILTGRLDLGATFEILGPEGPPSLDVPFSDALVIVGM